MSPVLGPLCFLGGAISGTRGELLTQVRGLVVVIPAVIAIVLLRNARRGILFEADHLTIRTYRHQTELPRAQVSGFELRLVLWRARRLVATTVGGETHPTPNVTFHDGILPDTIRGDRDTALGWGLPIEWRYTGQLPPPGQ